MIVVWVTTQCIGNIRNSSLGANAVACCIERRRNGSDAESRALDIDPYVPIGIVAFVFSLGPIYGSGADAGMWSLMLAVPV